MKTILWEIFVVIVIAVVLFFSKDASLNMVLVFYIYPAYLLIRLLMWLIMKLICYYGKLKVEQKPFLNKTTIKIGTPILAVLLLWAGYDLVLNIRPTATVIDAETGAPIEGAIALAQWYSSSAVIPEGRFENLDKTIDAFSGKDGKIHIGGFWGLFSDARLTVYKPGYVLWDSRQIAPFAEQRIDFDTSHRTVKLLKFDTEAARWLKENYYGGTVGLRMMHYSFLCSCCQHGGKIQDVFVENEKSLSKNDKFELSQKSKLKQ